MVGSFSKPGVVTIEIGGATDVLKSQLYIELAVVCEFSITTTSTGPQSEDGNWKSAKGRE